MEDNFEVLLTSVSWCATPQCGITPRAPPCTSSRGTPPPCLVGRDYLLSAPPDMPLLNVWQVNRSEQTPLRLFTPGPVSAKALSPSGLYLVAAVEEIINMAGGDWGLAGGGDQALPASHRDAVHW